MKKLIIIIFCLSIAFAGSAQCDEFIEGKEMQKGMYILSSNEGVENKKYVAQILSVDGKSFTCRFLHSNSLYQFVDVRNVNSESKSLLQATVKSNVGGGFGAGTIFVLNVYMPDPDLCDLGNATSDKVLSIIATFNTDKKSYVFVTGFGEIFPYLRASKFISNFEKYTTGKFKVVVFYPGRVDQFCHLFDKLNDDNPYRAIKLINDPYADSGNI